MFELLCDVNGCKMRNLLVLFVGFCCFYCKAYSQEIYSKPANEISGCIYTEVIGSICLISAHGEIGIDYPRESSSIRSFRFSIGAGIGLVSSVFVPVRLKVLIGDEHLLELGCGVLLQAINGTTTEGWYDWSDVFASPNALISYRYEPYDNGLLFRFSIDTAVDPPTGKFVFSPGISCGYSF